MLSLRGVNAQLWQICLKRRLLDTSATISAYINEWVFAVSQRLYSFLGRTRNNHLQCVNSAYRYSHTFRSAREFIGPWRAERKRDASLLITLLLQKDVRRKTGRKRWREWRCGRENSICFCQKSWRDSGREFEGPDEKVQCIRELH